VDVLPPPFGQSELTLKHVQQKWDPILRPDVRQDKDLEQDDDSKIARALFEE
jgi:hypothetical protein